MDACERPPRLSGEVEMDQAFFGTRKRKRYDSHGKPIEVKNNQVAVLGIIKRGGLVYTHIIKRMDRRTLIPIVHMVVERKSKVYTDMWRSFNKLNESGYKHYTINHSKRFSDGKGTHINNIEVFWSFAKRRLSQFNGLTKSTFPLHLKECEFRYNHRKKGELKKALSNLDNL